MRRMWFTVAILAVAIPVLAQGGRPLTPAVYAEALKTADLFLAAWLDRDTTSGAALLPKRLLSEIRADSSRGDGWFDTYMTGVSNPHHMSYEISAGATDSLGHITFPVVLYEHYLRDPTAHSKASHLVLVREREAWRVDEIPPLNYGN